MTPLLLCLALSLPAADEKPEPGPIRVLIIDGQNNHDWRSTTPLLKAHLEAAKIFKVDVTSHLKKGDKPGRVPTVEFPPKLTDYAVVVSNYNGAPWPEAFNKEFQERVHEGKLQVVIVHAANNSFTGWKEYNEIIGMGWRNPGFGDRLVLDADGKEVRTEKGKGRGAGHGNKHSFSLVVRDADHPVTKGMPREWMHTADELYAGMRGPIKNVKVLATSYSDKDPKKDGKGGSGEHEPMIWTVTYGKGRVFHTPMGHDTDGMRCVGFQATLQRGTEWAATGKVTLELPKNFPTKEATSVIEGGARRGGPSD